MAWFNKKKSSDVIDLTRLQREGVLQRAQETKIRQSTESERGVIDFTKSQNFNLRNMSSTDSSSDPGASALGFLSNLASSGGMSSNTESNAEDASYGSYTDRLKLARKSKLAEFNSMKIKLEDTEFKLNKALERLDSVERRLGEFENRANY